MIVRSVNLCEKCVASIPSLPIVVATNTSTVVLQDIRTDRREYMGRYIQNVGANNAYYSFDSDASPATYNGILQGGATMQQLDVSNFPGVVKVYATGGTTIAVTLLVRNDNAQGQGGIISGDGSYVNRI